ncbi:hypothetical protein TIFTF001_039744 [Ficus carica]|uniref:non-specific serine/threonine protein kinase n=1 Tax=Ficus carica TaxID=3494 RepID=A0AA87YNW0_FICCA|nr:hypothetical protein TIFTF001_039739 [Ficus carica]GMN19211.1 hypothetical protein TIFTF001_039744 [Ficus carica]
MVNLQVTLIFLLVLLKDGNSFNFSFTNFDDSQPNVQEILLENNASRSFGVLELSINKATDALGNSYGRASYDKEVQLWDPNTRSLTDFTTHFTFKIDNVTGENNSGDGIAFFIAPFNSIIPNNSWGGALGLFSPEFVNDSSTSNPIVAVEFDTYQNNWDPVSKNHVGIDVNSIVSKTNMSWTDGSMKDGRTANAWVSYDSTSQNLSVFLTYAQNPVFSGNSTLSYKVDLRQVLPEKVRVGFSASTGSLYEAHQIFPGHLTRAWSLSNQTWKHQLQLQARASEEIPEEEENEVSIDDEFEKGAGPKRFTYHELRLATNDFAEEGKLGEGGFGGVYRGLLRESNTEVAVKRISKASKQGKKEYISEVKIISLLRHRNLVQLIGWCHKQGEFLLVYEYLANGSLDTHLFGGKLALPWTIRHKIALGLASALLYLHEEWEQCVVHRDIKSSNVMLDSNFNAKLGDFGLARLVDHELSLHTAAFAGTMGYIAPECLETGKSSKESDVYSFGVVALEICCGRRPVVANEEEPNKVKLVGWVWELYGNGLLLDAVDERLGMEFDVTQIECLMIVGLWCCHPDPNRRPAIKQVMNVLNFEAPLPSDLPKELPKPMYFVPPPNSAIDAYSSSVVTGTSTASSTSANSSKPLLKFADC